MTNADANNKHKANKIKLTLKTYFSHFYTLSVPARVKAERTDRGTDYYKTSALLSLLPAFKPINAAFFQMRLYLNTDWLVQSPATLFEFVCRLMRLFIPKLRVGRRLSLQRTVHTTVIKEVCKGESLPERNMLQVITVYI